MEDSHLFEFESDFVSSLRCIPMAVRMKLDRCGLKLTLRQWSRFSVDDRLKLLHLACQTRNDIDSYQTLLSDLVEKSGGEKVMSLPMVSEALNQAVGELPDVVVDFAGCVGVRSPNDADWAWLSELQRFALIKLARSNHDNVNFVPALKEFGLL